MKRQIFLAMLAAWRSLIATVALLRQQIGSLILTKEGIPYFWGKRSAKGRIGARYSS